MAKISNILIGAFVVGLGLFGSYVAIGAKALMGICYNIVRYQIKAVTAETIELDVTLKLNNPSFLEVNINGYTIDVFLNNKIVGTIASKAKEKISGDGGISTILIPIKVAYKKTFGAVKSQEIINAFLTQNFDKIFVTLKGTFNGSVAKVPVSVPIDEQWTLKEIAAIMDEPDSAPCKT